MRKTSKLACGLALAATASLTATVAAPPAAGAPLEPFDSCADLLTHVRSDAARLVGPFGLYGAWTAGRPIPFEGVPVPSPTAEPADAAAPSDRAPGTDFSDTNVQETGVDEPDLVETDGTHVYTVAAGRLWIVEAAGADSKAVASLPLEGWNHQLLLDGTRLLVLSDAGEQVRPLPAASEEVYLPQPATTRLAAIDVANPTRPTVVQTLVVEGGLVSARRVGHAVRVVLASGPVGLPFAAPERDTAAAIRAATRANRRLVARSTAGNWLPFARFEDEAGPGRARRLVGCDEVSHPRRFGGLGLLTVLTIDLERGLDPVDTDAVMTDGQLVYASPTALYVATQRWWDPAAVGPGDEPGRTTSVVHKFDTSSPTVTAYRASGTVPGYLLNQFSLSEHDGLLRVASTEEPAWWTGDALDEGESFVTVLGERDGRLAHVGQVGGLGKGERIYAVRFLGTTAYVVTFRQTDPLYTIDLSDPARPRVAGELRILGYSAYLHPLGDGLLLGVGQDATAEGRTLGTQLSIFDVSDPANPRRLDQATIPNGSSEAEWDHHAFLWWPGASLAVLPVARWDYDPRTGIPTGFIGAAGYRVGRDGIARVGSVTHLPNVPRPTGGGIAYWYPGGVDVRRALVIGGSLYTVSEAGLKASDLGTLAPRGWVAFG